MTTDALETGPAAPSADAAGPQLWRGSAIINALPYIFLAASAGVFIFCGFGLQAPASVSASDIVAATNQMRQAAGLAPLHEDSKLDSAANLHVEDMVAKQYFAHVAPDGTQPWDWFVRQDYAFAYAGENLAINYDSARGVVAAWMNSSEHKANLLNPLYRDIGVSVETFYVGGQRHILVAELYGTPEQFSFR